MFAPIFLPLIWFIICKHSIYFKLPGFFLIWSCLKSIACVRFKYIYKESIISTAQGPSDNPELLKFYLRKKVPFFCFTKLKYLPQLK